MTNKPKIHTMSNDAVDRMDAFVTRATRDELGGRNDYWNELQAIINAGVTFGDETDAPISSNMSYHIEIRFANVGEWIDIMSPAPINQKYFAMALGPAGVTQKTRAAILEAFERALDDILEAAGRTPF